MHEDLELLKRENSHNETNKMLLRAVADVRHRVKVHAPNNGEVQPKNTQHLIRLFVACTRSLRYRVDTRLKRTRTSNIMFPFHPIRQIGQVLSTI